MAQLKEAMSPLQLIIITLLTLLVSVAQGSEGTVADVPHSALWHDGAPSRATSARARNDPHVAVGGDRQGSGVDHAVGALPAEEMDRDGRVSDTDPARGKDLSTSPLSFSSGNAYPPVTWSPWPHLAEPYKEATLIAESTVGHEASDLFMWSISSEDGGVFEGREIRHMFKTVGRKPVTLTQTVLATGEQYSLETFVMVKYVRRELRELTPEDREVFFNVMETMYRVETAEGKEKFGESYKGSDYFVQMHLDGAGTKECDHWHDDAGIVTHHVGYTLLFEQAMQRMDPSIAMPYWEYTIEAAQDISFYGESIVFDDEWFGEFSPQNEYYTMERGRFAYLPIAKESWDYVHNSYGLLRTPWNVNGSPYVTRHNLTDNEESTRMVSCSNFESCLQSSTLSVMHECLNGLTHGPVHIMTGGQWDNKEEEFIQKAGYSMLAPLLTKYLWRKGYLRTPEYCAPGDTCRASCPSEIYESRGMSVYDVLMDVHAMAWMSLLTGGLMRYHDEDERWHVSGHEDDLDFEDAFWRKMLHSFCDPGHVGEMYTSAAPYDPLFWVVHPTGDRLLAWRRLLAAQDPDNWAFDETWGYKHGFTIGETGVVCDWSGVDARSMDMPSCVKGICGGHKLHDMLPFIVEINGEYRQYTNAQWLDLVHPTNEDLPYMYDKFEWHHCTESGYDMATVSSDL